MDVQEKLLPFLKEHALALGLGFAGLVCLGYGLFSLSIGQQQDSGIDFQSGDAHAETSNGSSPAKQAKKITIDIEGAVEKPGVYTLPNDSRIQHDLRRAQ